MRSVQLLPAVDADGNSRKLAWEIIVVDDASPDGTQEVARQLAGLYGEDKVVSRPMLGTYTVLPTCTRY